MPGIAILMPSSTRMPIRITAMEHQPWLPWNRLHSARCQGKVVFLSILDCMHILTHDGSAVIATRQQKTDVSGDFESALSVLRRGLAQVSSADCVFCFTVADVVRHDAVVETAGRCSIVCRNPQHHCAEGFIIQELFRSPD